MIFTNKAYDRASFEQYNAAKISYIQTKHANYAQQTTQDKWNTLFTALKTIDPDDTRINDALRFFQASRIEGDANLFNLGLADCLNYFENFYFLLTTEDPRYKLSPGQKENLKEGIQDAMGTCETGIATRFEMVLQLYRTDMNWVSNALAKARYLLLSRISNAYCVQHQISVALEVHVLKIVTQTASEAGLGIQVDRTLRDIFERLVKRNDITEFFHLIRESFWLWLCQTIVVAFQHPDGLLFPQK